MYVSLWFYVLLLSQGLLETGTSGSPCLSLQYCTVLYQKISDRNQNEFSCCVGMDRAKIELSFSTYFIFFGVGLYDSTVTLLKKSSKNRKCLKSDILNCHLPKVQQDTYVRKVLSEPSDWLIARKGIFKKRLALKNSSLVHVWLLRKKLCTWNKFAFLAFFHLGFGIS